MPNRTLSPDELLHANELLEEIRARLKSIAGGDSALLFAYRRKIYKELTYDERGEAGASPETEGVQAGPASGSVCRMCRPATGSVRRTRSA